MHLLYAPQRAPDAYLVKALAEAGHVVDAASDWTDAQAAASGREYDAVLLDAPRPDIDQVRQVASAAGAAAVLVLAEVADAADRARLLRAGADACFVRPLHFIELHLRLEALKRRGPAPPTAGQALVLIASERAAGCGPLRLALSQADFRLLDCLAGRAGAVLSADRIRAQVWGDDSEYGPGHLRTAVSRLRGRLRGAFGQPFIATVRGHGYRFDPLGADPDG